MEKNVLEVDKLCKNFGRLKAVDQLSFKLEKGNVYGILGPNGSGKTTTLAMLSGVVCPSYGVYSWFGAPNGSNQRQKLGVLLEKPNFYGYMSALNNLKIVADIRSVEHSEIDDVLRQVGLYERRNSRFNTFSLGMKQRLAIGAVLLGNPEVLILDEPTNGLDPQGIAEVRNLIKDLASRDKTILLASHLLDEVQKVCNKMILLKNGKKLYDGSVADLHKGKNKVEIVADNPSVLEEVLKQYDYVKENDFFVLKVDKHVAISEINKNLIDNGVLVSHFAKRQVNLEENIFELLNEV